MEKIDIMSEFSLDKVAEAKELGRQDELEAAKEKQEVNQLIAFLESAKGLKSRAEWDRLGERQTKALTLLKKKLSHPNATARREIWMSIFSFRFTMPHDSEEQIRQTITELVEDGMLVAMLNGPISISDQSYVIPAASNFEDVDTKEVKEMVKICLNNLRKAIRNAANLTWKELVTKKPGRFSGYLQPEPFNNSNEEVSFRPGGILTIESERGFVKPVDGSGKLETGIQEMKSFEKKGNALQIPVSSLLEENPPHVDLNRFAPWKNLDKDEKPEDLNRRFISRTSYFWHLCKRMLKFATWTEKINSMASPKVEEFFLQRSIGKYILDFGGTWEQIIGSGKTQLIARPIVVIERIEDQPVTKKFLRLVEVPEYLTHWLADCRGEYEEIDEKFEGVPYPLRAFLQAMWGRVTKNTAHRRI